MPYASAVFVVLLEVLVGLFAERGLPPAAHAALALFWVFAVGRGTARLEQQSRREEKIRSMAEMLGLPEEILRDEFAEFMAQRKGDHDAKR